MKLQRVPNIYAPTLDDLMLPKDINTIEGRKKWLKGKTFGVGCCFCGKFDKNPECQLSLSIDKDEKKFMTWQIFWCHKKCLEDKLHKNFRCEFVLGDKK